MSRSFTTALVLTSAASAPPTRTASGRSAGSRSKVGLGKISPVELTPNEWVQAGRHRESFWLYVVWRAKTTDPRLLRIQDPVASLAGSVEELKAVNGYRVAAEAITRAAAL